MSDLDLVNKVLSDEHSWEVQNHEDFLVTSLNNTNNQTQAQNIKTKQNLTVEAKKKEPEAKKKELEATKTSDDQDNLESENEDKKILSVAQKIFND
jgi:hypothetical protein